MCLKFILETSFQLYIYNQQNIGTSGERDQVLTIETEIETFKIAVSILRLVLRLLNPSHDIETCIETLKIESLNQDWY